MRQNLLFGAPRQGGRLDLERIATLLEIEHLLERMPRNLSGGERQRVALGRAVLSEPQVLLCDEPFSALDAKRRQRLVPFVARIRDVLDIPMVLVSHNVSEVLALANEVVILEEGKIVAHGTTHDMLEALAHDEASALNFWEGVAEADPEAPDDEEVARVRVGEATIYAPFAAGSQAQRVRLSVSPNHVALATPETEPGSERNRFTGEVSAVSPQAGMLRVTLDARVPVTALITPDTARELQIAVGTRLTARFKVNAVQVLSVSGRVKRSDVASGD